MASGSRIADTTDGGSVLEFVDLRFSMRPEIGSGRSAHAVLVDLEASAGIAVLAVLVALVSAHWSFQATYFVVESDFPWKMRAHGFGMAAVWGL